MLNEKSKNPGVVSIKKICDGLEISVREFFDSDLFDDLEQEIKQFGGEFVKMYTISDFMLGSYKHFKGDLYTAYGIANDPYNNEYVVYQTKDKPNELWIRPLNIFNEDVELPEKKKIRFKKVKSGNSDIVTSMSNLVDLLKDRSKNCFFIHTESNSKFIISSISYDATSYKIDVCSLNSLEESAYLTDFQLALKMGYYLFDANGKKYIRELLNYAKDDKTFSVENSPISANGIPSLAMFSNPSSIDQHIDDKCYYTTRCKKIDLTSLNIINNQASTFWKKIDFKKHHGAYGLKLRPHQTILTHTLEKICIPSDCAGKIEIKSTYARLSLSVTNSDFCNPGWSGYYPLSIRNDGTNTVVIHPKEKMLQIMLVPTKAPIINRYVHNSTYMNDDGTPFQFWRSKTVNALKTEIGNDEI